MYNKTTSQKDNATPQIDNFAKTIKNKSHGLRVKFISTWTNSIYLLIVFTIMGLSCKPLSKVGSNNIKSDALTKDDFQKINGIYSNSFDTIIGGIHHSPNDGISDFQRLTILSQLFQNYPEAAWRDKNNNFISAKEKWIKIEFQSRKQATISMYHNHEFVFSKKIQGKFKNGFFYLRPKVYILPLIPLIFGYNFERARIGKTIDNNLIIDYSVNRWGFVLVAGSADKGSTSSIYKKKN